MWNDAKLINKLANILFGISGLCVIFASAWWVIHRPMFVLSEIHIEGERRSGSGTHLRHINAEIIRSTVLPNLSGNFFTTNLDNVRLIFETVPWVRKAKVQRQWPNKLVVTLEEYFPLGTWDEDGQLLSTKGDIFIANLAEAEEDAQLLTFSGPAGSEKEVLTHYLEFKTWFKEVSLAPEQVDYSKRYAWLIKLNNGLIVQLGREDNSVVLKERVDRLLQVYPELMNRLSGKIKSVDLRYPNGFALQTTDDGWQKTGVGKKKKS